MGLVSQCTGARLSAPPLWSGLFSLLLLVWDSLMLSASNYTLMTSPVAG